MTGTSPQQLLHVAAPRDGVDAGIVQVLGEDAHHTGMGMLLQADLVLTCAHVINLAVGRDILESSEPPADADILIGFPLLLGDQRRIARIETWSAPEKGSPLSDICLLRLTEPAPATVGIAILADIAGMDLDEDRLSVFGFPADGGIGRYVDSRFMGQASAAWAQIDGAGKQAFIEPGFSGAGVWDRRHECVIGMVVARQEREADKVAYLLPASQIALLSDEVPIERRQLSPWFNLYWTIYSAAVFSLLLVHFLAERYDQFPNYLSLGFGNKAVAALFGACIGALLLPFVPWKLAKFASSFREHPWFMRVPQFGVLTTPPQPCRTRFSAVVSVFVLLAVPLYLQGHLMKKFLDSGDVYVSPASFGLDVGSYTAKFGGHVCGKVAPAETSAACTHPAVGKFQLLGLDDGFKDIMWDNGYKYGDISQESPNAVTFYPVLQPAIMILLSLLSALLAFKYVVAIVRPARTAKDTRATAAQRELPLT